MRADEADRRRLNDLFVELCRIESPSGQEAECAARVRAELEGLGLPVEADEAGNVLARVAAAGDRDGSVMLCAHLDTVKLEAPVEPALVDDGWENANEGILGADNKAAVAMLLAIAHRAAAAPPPIGLELLFTISEEVGLVGAQAFDLNRLRSRFGYVFDHATPIGEIVLAAPTYYRVEAEFRGAAAHAGIRPEQGRSAISAAVAVAEAALQAAGYEPRHIDTGGGSDANAFNAAGFECVNLANGTERNHEPGERVSVAALEGMLDVSLALIDEAAARC